MMKKQSQFPEHVNGYKLSLGKGLCKKAPPAAARKQSQFKANSFQVAAAWGTGK
jgi:hypothetical protein